MRVALELQPCCGKRSGIGTYTYELATRLKDRDDLEFCGNLFNFLGSRDDTTTLSGITMPVRVNRMLAYGVYRRIWMLMPVSYQAMFPSGADLNIFFNFVVPPRVNGKVITTVHDLTYLRFPETVDTRNLKRLEKGLQRSIERSDRIITVSEFSKREIMELLKVPEERISVVCNAPSLVAGTADFGELSIKYGIAKPYLLYVGTIEPRKNLVRLLKTFDLLKKEQKIPHQLVLAGGKGWKSEDVYKTAGEMSSTKDVRFTDYVTGEEKNALYQNAAGFIFPSLYEGFGIPPLEAMTFGCPVVCADAASLPEVVGDAAELVDPLSETSIAQGIWNVIASHSRSDELVRRGYEQTAKYNWDSSAKQLTDICKAVLGAK